MAQALLFERISRSPRIFDPAYAERTREALIAGAPSVEGLWATDGPARALLDGTFGCSPYLARVAQRHVDFFAALAEQSPEDALEGLLNDVLDAGRSAADEADAKARLRQAKQRAHLTIALADIAGAWTLSEVTGALTRLADLSVQAALAVLARRFLSHPRGTKQLAETDAGIAFPPGLFVLALGKMGGGELNYSSDIDVTVLFDRDRLADAGAVDPKLFAVTIARSLSSLLQDVTAEGYAFRVDLRLRPDPSSTPPAVSTVMALGYYEALGATWERAALIKARCCAGDEAVAADFLHELKPFIWRRSVDFSALEDLHAMKRRMHAHGPDLPMCAGGTDLKRDRGGIRDIEFFAQAQQLIFGGRDEQLRQISTLDALKGLVAKGHVSSADAETLTRDYEQLRLVEHRLQMIEDQQTHTLPEADVDRDRVAAFCGSPDLAFFDADILQLRARVYEMYADVFASVSPVKDADVFRFDREERDADNCAALAAMGFENPASVISTARGWQEGRVRATQSPRSQERLDQFLPVLLRAAADTEAPDIAFARFARFFERLPAGVQILSLFTAEPGVVTMLVQLLASAPRLAPILARRPNVLDAVLDEDFEGPLLTDADELSTQQTAIASAGTFEEALNAARRTGAEHFFRIGAHVLLGMATAKDAGAAYASLADMLVMALTDASLAETTRRHGSYGGEFIVVGLGKLGGRELSAGSDLDLVTVYREAASDYRAQNAREIHAQTYYARATQRLISALSSPTEEGDLYEVDMQLRPSGSAGPISTRLSAWEHYYREDAWTWELMALTRARVIAGSPALASDFEARLRDVLTCPRDRDALARDVGEMRARIEREKPAKGRWDLKLAPGGLVDIEFTTQFLQLASAHGAPEVLDVSTIGALERLQGAAALSENDARTLIEAARLQLSLSQLIRVAYQEAFEPEAASPRFLARLAQVGGSADFPTLERRLVSLQSAVRECFERIVCPSAD